ncbi:hypothetical protein [Actinosynnema pretiosum]|uniref:Uncharacterized protein n=1 Tax=Actinosynnema pretiosum TaxID=42197 RepID=A0A290Z9Q8_9PSEU|nr:hypothetical protein [Actinosynnema pretiosum]ATE55712.1 hypothetical protein CNX65_22480 [Actinosynnema pretiosum]
MRGRRDVDGAVGEGGGVRQDDEPGLVDRMACVASRYLGESWRQGADGTYVVHNLQAVPSGTAWARPEARWPSPPTATPPTCGSATPSS